jgi:FOG: HPt domain
MMDEGYGGPAVEGKKAPLDLAHLERQTMGDESLRRDVMALFDEQMNAVRAGLAEADEDERRQLAHRLAGSARALGAFALAEGASRLEAAPSSDAAAKRLLELIEETAAFIARHVR